MLESFILFFVAAGVIYCSCEYFVNAIEWCGRHMDLGTLAVGSVLAAFGTALPESIVTLMAVVFGRTPAQKEMGVGAAMGGPLVLSTLAYAVAGFAFLLTRRGHAQASRKVPVDRTSISRDQGIFVLVFGVNVLLGLVSFPHKSWLGLVLVATYLVYVLGKVRSSGAAIAADDLEPLKICRFGANTALGWAALQASAALIAIGIASHIFVAQLGTIGTAFHLSPQLAALLLSPVATELPETMNALIWIRQGKEQLALANISGAMMIQATIPAALGVFFTGWRFDRPLLASGVITIVAIAFLWRVFRSGSVDARSLLVVSALYGVFALFVAAYFTQWLQRVPPEDRARIDPAAGSAQAIAAGRVMYSAHCAQCHKENALGDGRRPSLRSKRLRSATDGDIEWFLRVGNTGQGMPSWSGLNQAQRWQLVTYLKSIQ